MAISEQAKEITSQIYSVYGTDSGILFGIPSNCLEGVRAVVQVVLDEVAQPKLSDATEED